MQGASRTGQQPYTKWGKRSSTSCCAWPRANEHMRKNSGTTSLRHGVSDPFCERRTSCLHCEGVHSLPLSPLGLPVGLGAPGLRPAIGEKTCNTRRFTFPKTDLFDHP